MTEALLELGFVPLSHSILSLFHLLFTCIRTRSFTHSLIHSLARPRTPLTQSLYDAASTDTAHSYIIFSASQNLAASSTLNL